VIQDERVRVRNERGLVRDGAYVLYWMQQAQRARANHALEYAVRRADDLGLPVVAGFGLTDDYPEANERHYAFLLEGLAETRENLDRRRIPLVVRRGAPPRVALGLAADAALVVCDRGWLRHQRAWREDVARRAACRVVEVDTDSVVPVEAASGKREYAARTIRPRIRRRLDAFLVPLAERGPERGGRKLRLRGDVDVADPSGTLASLRIDRTVARVHRFRGGASQARARLARFLRAGLAGYGSRRVEPGDESGSSLSPYLHFGQISALEIALAVRGSRAGTAEDREAFLEQLVVRRELAVNFVWYAPDYDRYATLPAWARETLAHHCPDGRPHVYTRAELESAATHDRYWNAAMREMTATGFLPNAMRMYWGKKILEWSRTPEHAFRTALALNNRLFLDGRDPNSHANVAWLFGLHDRPWAERPVFGTVRFMNAAGLERKYDMERYLRAARERVDAEAEAPTS